jgi:hypothetical protein
MFIHSSIDEAGLSPVAFRVLAHICRRAGEGNCWAAAKTISETCRINIKSARKAVAELERMGWIEVQKRAGQTSVLIPKMNGQTLPNPIPYPIQYPTQMDAGGSTQSDTQGSTQMDTHEGIPIRDTNKGTQSIDAITLPFESDEFRQAWQDWINHRKEIRKKITPLSARKSFSQFVKIGEARTIAAINNSIMHGWTGIFEAKQSEHSASHREAKKANEYPERPFNLADFDTSRFDKQPSKP